MYHGPLGVDCKSIVEHFEHYGAPKIEMGENPANWMLRVITMDGIGDLAAKYLQLDSYRHLCEEIEELKNCLRYAEY